ncbi:MAG: EamA family transporter RarD [Phycisphaerales bacterium]|nr:EamA family transporter RarD [Phycisphaerales bacterium]
MSIKTNLPGDSQAPAGVIYAVCGYGWWALVTPLYFHAIREVPALEQLSWRVVSGIPTLLFFLWMLGRLGELKRALLDRRVLGMLGISSLLIGANWFIFLWAVMTDRLSHASLGYYLSPLVSVLLGRLVLGERLRGVQWFAIAVAAVGVGLMAMAMDGLPWIALAISGSFAFYGLVRKQVNAAPAPGLAVEMILLAPLMVAFMVIVQVQEGMAALGPDAFITTLLVLGGVQTMVPLIFFAAGAKRLQLSTLGILQYISPTGQLILAVLVLGESFDTGRLVAFACIWAAVGLYSGDALLHSRRRAFDLAIPGET